MSNEYQGGYTRRQELTCTEAQIATYADLVLHENEKIYVRMNSGVIRMKLGDGVTGLRDLPYTKIYDGDLETVEALFDEAVANLEARLAEYRAAVDEKIEGKFDKANVAQELGDSEEKVLSQKAVTRIFESAEITKNLVVFSADTLEWQENSELGAHTYPNGGLVVTPSSKTKVNFSYGFPTEVGKTYRIILEVMPNTFTILRLVINKNVLEDTHGAVDFTTEDGTIYVGEITAQNEETYINLVTTYGVEKGVVLSAWGADKNISNFSSEFLNRQTDVKKAREHNNVIDEVVNTSMTKEEFVTAINAKFFDYATLCRCHPEAFSHITSDMSWGEIYSTINKNFRREVCIAECSKKYNYGCINSAFTVPVYRFQDAVFNDGATHIDDAGNETNVKASLKLPLTQGDGEPTALISPDSSEIWLYCGSKMVLKSTDGYHYTKKGDITLNKPIDDSGYVMHPSFSVMHDYEYDESGVVTGETVKYYMLGASQHSVDLTVNGVVQSSEKRDFPLYLYESSDGLNFDCIGKIFDTNLAYAKGKRLASFGNSAMWKEGDVWYLLYEMQDRGYGTDFATYADYDNRLAYVRGWEICLATATDPFCKNADGTIGNWVQCNKNPVIPYKGNKDFTNIVNYRDGKPAWQDRSNPDLATRNNIPVKVDGKYHVYIHSELSTQIRRLYSYNLVDWVDEGVLLDVRDKPRVENPSNGDHTITEFKGRTFLFYTHNINGEDQSYMSIRLLVDDRDFNVLLQLKP